MRYPLFWIRSSNFGDILNPILYKHITGREPYFSTDSPVILAIGSIMALAKDGDIVWGTGCMSDKYSLYCGSHTRFQAVRGPFTAAVLEKAGIKLSDSIPFGDPSILMPRFIEGSPGISVGIGLLPHYVDYQPDIPVLLDTALLNPATPPLELIQQITSCSIIASSSLHGIIVAEAYGHRAVWIELSDNVAGEGFKFRDYYASTWRNIGPVDCRTRIDWKLIKDKAMDNPPPVDLLNKMGDRLYEVCPFLMEMPDGIH